MKINDYLYLVGTEQFGLSHPLDCNCYLLDGGGEKVLIDTGTGMGASDILANMSIHGFQPQDLTHILITHVHLGHWGASTELREATGAQVYAPELHHRLMEKFEEDYTIVQNLKFGRYPAGYQPTACIPDETFGDGDSIQIGDIALKTVLVQGHTRDSTCFYFTRDDQRGLFSGDVVFYGGALGLINADGCSLSDYRRDIGKITQLKVDMLLPGHGVFILRNGYKHVDRAARKLADFVMPETFFETNEFSWDKEYFDTMLSEKPLAEEDSPSGSN